MNNSFNKTKLKYRIEVYLDETDIELEEPYFWRLAVIDDNSNLNNWCTNKTGYGRTYQDAFNQALSYYLKYKQGE